MSTFVPRSLEELALVWPAQLDHISASSLKMAVRCPEQWRQVYVHGRRIAPNAAMILGGADHAAIEFSMEQKITSYVDLPTVDVVEKFDSLVDERVEADGGLNEIEIKHKGEVVPRERKSKVLGDLKGEGCKAVGAYHDQVSPTVQPVAVEEEFRLRPEGLPVDVIGRLDLVAGARDGNGLRTIERKRRGRKSSKPEAEWMIAAEIYQLARQIPTEWHITVPYASPVLLVPDGSEATQSLVLPVVAVERAERTLAHIVGEIGYLFARYGPDEEWPAKGKLHPWACGYCGFRANCWAWKEG